MHIAKFASLASLLTVVGCVCCGSFDAEKNSAVSPDGRNEIRLYSNPLAYEIVRDGVVVAARSEIGMKVNGTCLKCLAKVPVDVTKKSVKGVAEAQVYKKDKVCLAASETFVDFGEWGVRLTARNDGVAYRFETKFPGRVKVDCEKASLALPAADVKCWGNQTGSVGCEETIPFSKKASEIDFSREMVYLPFAYSAGGKFVVVTESDVRDYPIWNFGSSSDGTLESKFVGEPKKTSHVGGWGNEKLEKGGRWVKVEEHEDFISETDGTRTFPWRTFILADTPAKVCEADIVWALAPAQDKGADFSWVKPGKVAWDWWNCFDNIGDPEGCTTKTYERFIDFAAANGVEYVIFDEGWSEKLNIWKYSPVVDVPHLIEYGEKKGVGIILWMAWAQIYGDEEHVAEQFAKLGAKGFKVDFMDRGDAEVANFLEKFAAACAKNHMLVDYHGAYRPNGLHRRFPNLLNYEGIHGLEQLKWFDGNDKGLMFSDVAACFLRMSAGPMDYTPGAMLNHGIGSSYRGSPKTPGSVGTRCRQMAMMALYEAPLQMLSDSPTLYEKNIECFSFMAKVPTVWKSVVALGGCPDSMFAAARQTRDGEWYAAGMTTADARDFEVDTSFLGKGEWKAELFRDAGDAKEDAAKYVHETKSVKAGDKMSFHMAPGGGFIVRFTK